MTKPPPKTFEFTTQDASTWHLGDASRLETGVWWDLNTCPVPDNVDLLAVRRCIESAKQTKIGRSSAVSIYAMGNLEYISSDLMEMTSSETTYTMLISDDYRNANPSLFRLFGFTNFVAYPKHGRLLTLAEQSDPRVLANDFVWETLLFDNYVYTGEVAVREDEPLYICNICNTCYEIFDEFTTHLNSEEHRTKLFKIVPRDFNGNIKHLCQVCNYPAYDDYNLLLHNKSEEHCRKLQAQEEEYCKSRKKRSPQWDPVGESIKKQSLERGKQ